MTISCRDTDSIAKVHNAGGIVDEGAISVQIMHNGLKVVAGGYYGDWMSEIIRRLNGHHEPQEELLFDHILKVCRPGTTIAELGSFWSYYSLWYVRSIAHSRALCIEPDSAHLEVGRRNAELNDLEDRVRFVNAWVGQASVDAHAGKVETDGTLLSLPCLDAGGVLRCADGKGLEILHVDTQGAELGLIRSIEGLADRIRFLFVSTHHHSISGSWTTHADCIEAIKRLGGEVLAEHSVEQSFSGDGLIVASFHDADKGMKLPKISVNRPENSLFGAQPKSTFVSYAQNFEDVILWRAFKHKSDGFYIDIGAQHPEVDSVSRAFYLRGWRGVHVEPSVEYAAKLRHARPDETVVECAVSNRSGKLTFYNIAKTGLSTADAAIAAEHRAAGFAVEQRSVESIATAALLDRFKDREIHWLKIDVEGFEAAVISGWAGSAVRPWVIVVESTAPNRPDPTHAEWDADLINLGYDFVYFDGLNRFYVSRSHPELKPHFGHGPNVFDDFVLSPNSNFCRFAAAELTDLRAEVEMLRRGRVMAGSDTTGNPIWHIVSKRIDRLVFLPSGRPRWFFRRMKIRSRSGAARQSFLR